LKPTRIFFLFVGSGIKEWGFNASLLLSLH